MDALITSGYSGWGQKFRADVGVSIPQEQRDIRNVGTIARRLEDSRSLWDKQDYN